MSAEEIRMTNVDEAGLLGIIDSGALFEYTTASEHFTKRLAMAREENGGAVGGVIASLDYADVDHVLLDVLDTELEAVFRGLDCLRRALGTDMARLYFPENETKWLDREDVRRLADMYGVEVAADFPDRRSKKGILWVHMLFAAQLAHRVEGEAKMPGGIYISVNGARPVQVEPDMPVRRLLWPEEEGEKSGIIRAGYQYVPAESLTGSLQVRDICNGVLRLADAQECVIMDTQEQLRKYREQSCGKCVFCREGLIQLEYMTNEITQGRGKAEQLDLMREIGQAMEISNYCTLGQQAPSLILSALDHCADEYTKHIRQRKCTAGVCFSDTVFYIDPQLCTGCTECMDVCPLDCIEGRSRYIHMIDEMACDGCGKCMEACQENAVVKTADKLPKLPDKLTKVGRFKTRR